MHEIRDGKVYDEETGKLLKTSVEHGITYDENDDVVTFRALSFKTFADFANEEPKNWLIEGVIALGEDSTWFGKDGAGKSTLIDDIAIHVAGGRDWRGHKFNHSEEVDPAAVNEEEQRGVIIFATERAALHRRRLEAYKKRDNLPDNLPIAVIDEVINLCDPTCVEIVSDTIYEFERQNNCAVGLVIIDSWSKALGGCDENLAATQNFACLSLKKIRDRYLCSKFHLLTVGHPGKDGSKGERGNSAKRAHMDMAVYINDGVAEVIKANDIVLGDIATFKPLEFTVTRPPVVLGKHNIPERSFIVSLLAPYDPAAMATDARPAVSKAPTGKHAQVLDALRRAIVARGQDGAVHVDFWREELSSVDLLNLKAKNPRSAFKKLRDSVAQHIIAEPNGVVRFKNEIPTPGNLPACPVYPSSVPTSPS
jgi:hypothetical protein